MKVFARWELTRGKLTAAEPALLLEGAWPDEAAGPGRWSLDESVDARHAWIDREAAELAETFAAPDRVPRAACPAVPPLTIAYLHAAKLRYHLVKLLRVVAFFRDVQPPAAGTPLEAYLQRDRDADYADVLALCAEQHGLTYLGHESAPAVSVLHPAPAYGGARASWWRRLAARMQRRIDRPRPIAEDRVPRVVLCGNPRCLDAVGDELLRRGTHVWWLYEKFALRSWLKWRPRRVRQLCCDDASASPQHPPRPFGERAGVRGSSTLDKDLGSSLAPLVDRWLARLARHTAEHDAQVLARLETHFRAVRPTHVVVDQDQTPFNRAVVALARQHGAKSIVVQHGAPYVRFGFAPLEADLFAAWGETSREQLRNWDVPAERIHVTGSPTHTALLRTFPTPHSPLPIRTSPPTFLLLATVPPRDARPDAVSFHLTTRTHTEMLRATFAALEAIPGANVIVKLHPRDPDTRAVRHLLAEFPHLRAQIVRRGGLARWLPEACCVLSCASSAGIEATLAGVPVIQLLPRGSDELLEASTWGLVGTARSREELERLLGEVMGNGEWGVGNDARRRSVFGADVLGAARRVIDVLLADSATDLPVSAAAAIDQPSGVGV